MEEKGQKFVQSPSRPPMVRQRTCPEIQRSKDPNILSSGSARPQPDEKSVTALVKADEFESTYTSLSEIKEYNLDAR